MRPVTKLISHLPMRIKLALLAGVPVAGAVALSLLIALDSSAKAAKARSLGSVESLAELCAAMSHVSRELHVERARTALFLGRSSTKTAVHGESSASQFERTDRAVAVLNSFLEARDTSKLPARLAERLRDARKALATAHQLRRRVGESRVTLEEVMRAYRGAPAALIGATAALSELTDDGELLRLINVLVALQEFAERASQEHALLSYVFAVDQFPPGSYRELVTLLTEAQTHQAVLLTNAAHEQRRLFESLLRSGPRKQSEKLRKVALESTEDGFGVDAGKWFRLQQSYLDSLRRAEATLNRRVRAVALAKQREMRAGVTGGLGLAGGVLVVSLILGWVIATGVSSSIGTLTEASRRIGQGELPASIGIESRDELGTLGRVFEEMVKEIGRSRKALSEQARIGRELEIAASIQRALLPPCPLHPQFGFAGRMLPADEVGGDFYDVLYDETKDSLWITIGDVSSHGLGSGLVMMMTQAAFSSHFRANPRAAPEAVIEGVNAMLCEAVVQRLKDNKYVTAQLLEYTGHGDFRCAGGHQTPLVYRSSQRRVEPVEMPGPWLGIFPNLPRVPVASLHLDPGDIVCLYSDGIIEAQSEDGQQFDVGRLREVFEAMARSGAGIDAIANRVMASVAEHAARREDDWTLLLVQRNSLSSFGPPTAESHERTATE